MVKVFFLRKEGINATARNAGKPKWMALSTRIRNNIASHQGFVVNQMTGTDQHFITLQLDN